MFHEIMCVWQNRKAVWGKIDIIFSYNWERPDKYVSVNKWAIVYLEKKIQNNL